MISPHLTSADLLATTWSPQAACRHPFVEATHERNDVTTARFGHSAEQTSRSPIRSLIAVHFSKFNAMFEKYNNKKHWAQRQPLA